MDKDKEEKISKIDERIEDLKEHMKLWGNAGGIGGNMMMMASHEIHELEMEKNDIINGTHELEIDRIKRKIKQLELLREEANFIKRVKYNKEIKQMQTELGSYEETSKTK